MLELHIWGSAFGLPSIDPECLALVTYLNKAAPKSSYRIVASNDPAVSQSNQLPALNHDGVWTSGFRQITTYLSQSGLISAPHLTPSQRADITAYTSFVTSHLAPLLSLSLYVSSANWAATTRPAYSALLSFPLTWTVPPLIRQNACLKTEHLGLAELDTDFDPNGGLHLSTGKEHLPESFRRHLPDGVGRRSVREEMTPEQKTAIRLFALAEEALGAFAEMLKEGSWLVGDEATELDCLAFGYLALMKDAPVPRAFLKDWIEEKAPQLFAFVDRVKEAHLQDLPVVETPPRTFLKVTKRTLDSCLLNTPGVGEHYAAEVRQRAEKGITGLDGRAIFLTLSLMITGAAAGYGVYFYRSMPKFGARTQLWKAGGASKLSQFGNLGVMLDSALGPRPSQPGRFVETDSEVD